MSVFATGKKSGEYAQIGRGEQPAVRMLSGSFGGTDDRAKMFAARKAVKMIQADSRETGDFLIREKFLAGLDGDQFKHHP